MAWTRAQELELAESCLARASLAHRRQAREEVRRLRAELDLKAAAEAAEAEARERPGWRADLDG